MASRIYITRGRIYRETGERIVIFRGRIIRETSADVAAEGVVRSLVHKGGLAGASGLAGRGGGLVG